MAIVDKMELQLRPPSMELAPYPPKFITLATGEKLVVRPVEHEEIPLLMETIEPLMKQPKDFYDIVASRIYAELLGHYRHRVKDEYVFVGAVNGVIAGIVNGRLVNEKIGMSYHTITLKRGLRVGAQLFAAKMEYHFMLGQEEVYIVAESPNGFKRWMIEYELISRPEIQHELGGVPTYVLTRELWEKHKGLKNTGRRPVPDELMEKNARLIKPDNISV